MISKAFLFLLFFSTALSAPHEGFDPEIWLRERDPAITLQAAADAVTNRETRLDFRLASFAWLKSISPERARERARLVTHGDDPVMRAACADSVPGPDDRLWRFAVGALPEGEISFALNYAQPGALMQPRDMLALAPGGDAEDEDESQEELRSLFTELHFMRLQRYAAVLKMNEAGELLGVLIVMQGIFSRAAFIQTLDLDDKESRDLLTERGKFLIYENESSSALVAISGDFLVVAFGQTYLAQRHLLDGWMEKYARAEAAPESHFARRARTLGSGFFAASRGEASSAYLQFFGLEDFDACDLELHLESFTTGKFTAECRYTSPALARANEDRFRKAIQDFRANLYPPEDWKDLDAWLRNIQIRREGGNLSFESMGEIRLDQLLIYAELDS
ncbi:MAG: hypothetical protein LBC99_02490 [Spirochaetota bacterium]|jgi:hypothetical protein|nr:hypothetical protein [Spirochaetota bacterium]